MKKKNVNKQSLYLIVVLVILVFLFILGVVVFANKIMNNSSKTDDKDINLVMSEKKEISIKNMLPLNDEVGKKIKNSNEETQEYFDFTLKSSSNKDVNYELYLTDNNGVLSIEPYYVKIYLTDGLTDKPFVDFDKNEVPTFYDLKVSDGQADGKKLINGVLKAGEIKKFRLRMWLSSSYVINTEQKSFSTKVNVRTF